MWKPLDIAWLQKLQPGDAWTSVIPHQDHRTGRWSVWPVDIRVVKRLTNELVVCVGNTEERYRLKDGAKIGGLWHNLPSPATEEEVRLADRENRFADMVVRLQTTEFKTLPFETVEALHTLLQKTMEGKKNVRKTVRAG